MQSAARSAARTGRCTRGREDQLARQRLPRVGRALGEPGVVGKLALDGFEVEVGEGALEPRRDAGIFPLLPAPSMQGLVY